MYVCLMKCAVDWQWFLYKTRVKMMNTEPFRMENVSAHLAFPTLLSKPEYNTINYRPNNCRT